MRGILQEEFNRLEKKLDMKFASKDEMQSMFTHFQYKIQGMFTDLKSEFFNKIDPFLKEIEIARDDRDIATKHPKELIPFQYFILNVDRK